MSKFDDILQVIGKRGQNPVIGDIYQMMANWKSWYRGNVNDFHRYNLKTINGKVSKRDRVSMQMAKKVCEDWATLLFNEEVTLNVLNDDKLNEQVQEVLEDNNFRVEFSALLEKSFALGTGAVIEFTNSGKVMIDYITGDLLIVTSYRNQKINGLCTVNAFKKGQTNVTHLTFHDYTNGVYTIENMVFTSDKDSQLGKAVPLETVFGNEAPQEMIEMRVSNPHFQVIKPNVVNNFDLENPMGVSVFANAIDTLKTIDLKNDSFSNEYEAARHRIIIKDTVTKMQSDVDSQTGNLTYINYFDSSDMVYQSAPFEEGDPIHFYNAEIRAEQHIKGIQTDMQLLGFKCGLGTDYYSFDARGVYQNEKAIVSENSDLWASKSKHELIIEPALRNIVKSIVFLLTGREIKDSDVSIALADSIVIDDEAMYNKDMELVDRGMMAEWQFLVKWHGLTEQEAKDQIEEAQQSDTIEMEFDEEVPEDVDGGEEV